MQRAITALVMRFAVPLTVVALAGGCAPKPPTAEQLAIESRAVTDVLTQMFKAYAAKDTAGVLSTYPDSGEMMGFGTDSAEVMRSKADALAQVRADWTVMDSARVSVGEFRNLHVMVASSGDMASAAGELPMDVVAGAQRSHTLYRFGVGLRKEGGKWKIVHSVVGVATTGQSSAELVVRARQAKR